MVDRQLLAYLQTFLTESRKEVFERILAHRTRHFTVVLEDLYQKHNTGAVMRSCDVFGLQDVYYIEQKYKGYLSNKVAKGAEKWVDLHLYRKGEHTAAQCADDLVKKGYQLVVTTPHRNASELDNFDISKPSAFVFGVEKEGVSDYMMQRADAFLKIPMVGFTESLNVSVAAGIILQSLTSRLRKSAVPWQLSEEEKNEKKLEWSKKSIAHVEQIIKRFYADRKIS